MIFAGKFFNMVFFATRGKLLRKPLPDYYDTVVQY